MRLVFPELETNLIAQEAVRCFPEVEFVSAEGLGMAAEMVKRGEVDSMVSGLDYASRDVLLAYKEHLALRARYFSSCFICEREGACIALADGGVNKQPDAEQLYATTVDTAETYAKYTGEQPRIAMLSYSTNGSGGKNPDLAKIHYVIGQVREEHPEWLIDGEMQLDAAIDPGVSERKYPESAIGGKANVLIVPDLNTGNILYKALERFGGFTVAGPMIQGFTVPLADLSRGSTLKDTILTIKVLRSLL
ncbi:phosphate acetyltransferase [Candidatus Saccharibacteria bacterium]|nr:phosphate acetyltransferase [Candidatus Saccharibacteria bacterium]